MVEQWTHKPLVVGSNPTLATTFLTQKPACQAGFCVYTTASQPATVKALSSVVQKMDCETSSASRPYSAHKI